MIIRFVGGSLHGKTKDVDRGAKYVETHSYGYGRPGEIIPMHSSEMPVYRRETYERRRIYLSSLVAVEVMVYVMMQENEALRALANIIDGV